MAGPSEIPLLKTIVTQLGGVPIGVSEIPLMKQIVALLDEGVGGGSGTVTSVDLSLPSIFTVSGNPVTTSGTLTAVFATQAANTVFAGPTAGLDAAPTFRALVAADMVAAGNNTEIQFNNSGAFGASTGLFFTVSSPSVELNVGQDGVLVGQLHLHTDGLSNAAIVMESLGGGAINIAIPTTAATRAVFMPDADGTLMINPMTTAGDVVYGGASGLPTRLGIGTALQVLQTNAGATAPEWVGVTGTGNVARATSPTFVTPVLGAATATSINGLTVTSSTGALTITNSKTLSVSNTLTLAGTDGSTLNIGTGGVLGTAAYTAATAYTSSTIVPSTAPSAGQILIGNAGGTAYAPFAMSGDVTITSSGTATIANDAVTNAKAANMAQSTIKGRAAAAGTGDQTDLTPDQTSTILDGATDPFLRTSAASFATLGANTFTALQTITQASANAGILASTGYSLTGSDATSMVDLSGSTNTTGNFVGFKLSIANTASGANANLFQILAGAAGTTNAFSINASNGNTYITVGANTFLQGNGGTNFSIYGASTDSRASVFSQDQIAIGGPTVGVNLVRDAADVLALRRDTTAQTSRVYGTYTDASNYVRASLAATSTLVTLAAETAGTGADNVDINLTTAGTGLVNFATQAPTTETVVSDTTAQIKIGGTTFKVLLKA
jgi:hypothetical protein